MSDYLAAYNPAKGRDPRGKTHAMQEGTQHPLCSTMAVTPRFPERAFDPNSRGVCDNCARIVRATEAPPSSRAERAAYDKGRREQMVKDKDRAVREFMLALHTGGINNTRGNHERATETMTSYYGTVTRLRRFVNEKPWDEISPSEIHAFLHQPKPNGEPRSLKTINQNHTALCTFYDFLLDRELIEGRSPMRHVGRPRETEESEDFSPGRLPAEQEAWTALMASSLGMDDRLVLGLAYFAGMRISEVVIVRPQRINPLQREMDFWRPKSRRWQRDFGYGHYVDGLKAALPERADGADDWLEVMEWMTKYRRNDDTLVVSGSINEPEDWWADRLEHHLLPKAGLAPNEFTLHQLRHNFGHNMVDAGMDVRELRDAMGHKSLATTDTYIRDVKSAKKFADRIRAIKTAAAAEIGQVVALERHRRVQG